MKRTLAALVVAAALLSGACSASGSVDTKGDGVNIDADVDGEK